MISATCFILHFIAGNGLTGEIPEEIRILTSLESFNVFMNMLSGEIPDVLNELSNLEMFDVGDNDLSGPPIVNVEGLTS